MQADFKNLKIAVVHDHLGFCGGGERTALIMAHNLGADFITAHAHAHTFPEYQARLGSGLKILADSVISARVLRFFWLRWQFFKNRKMLENYDVLIASSQAATEAVAFYAKPQALKIVYTHTTPRRVFDMYAQSKAAYPLYLRPFYALFARFWKFLYLKAISRLDINIANSQNILKRIKAHTKMDAQYTVWPPIIADKFKFIESGDYFLSYGRLDEAKRIELITEAFREMPDKKLIITSGGPRFNRVKELAAGCENIKVLGWVDDEKLFDLVGRARALVYIPCEEDAGMTHLEGNTAGKPYLGVREGGLIESTIENETGILIPARPTKADVIAAANQMTADWCRSKKDKCIAHAKQYQEQNFSARLREIIADNDPRLPILGIDAGRWEDPRFPGERRRTGVEIYAWHIISSLIAIARQQNMRVRVYAPRAIQSLPRPIQKILPPGRGWTRKKLSQELKNSRVDYFFTPSYYIPKNAPQKSFAVIHDVIFKSAPERYSFQDRLMQNYASALNIKRAEKIFTVSNFSKKEIIKYSNLPEEKVVNAGMGYLRNIRHPIPNSQYSKKLQIANCKFILYIGRIEKKKSVAVLVKAFQEFSYAYADWHLVLAGADGYGAAEIKKLIADSGLAEKISLPGFVSEEEKWQLLREADIYVHPSAHEGSAIPLLEAMDAGVPAIASDIEAMREIGQDALVYFKTEDYLDLSERLKFIVRHPEIAQKNITSGQELLKQRSWEKSAEMIYEKIVK